MPIFKVGDKVRTKGDLTKTGTVVGFMLGKVKVRYGAVYTYRSVEQLIPYDSCRGGN